MDLEGPLVVFIICGLPIVLGVSVAIYGQRLRHKQLTLMMDERRLLIENGVTNLPRLELPAQSSRRVGLFDLRAGIVFISIALGLLVQYLIVQPAAGEDAGRAVQMGFIAVLGALGTGLVAFHFIARAYARQDQPPASADSDLASHDAGKEHTEL